MRIELIRGSHSVTETNMHLQVTPAFRQDVFEDELMRVLVRDYALAQAYPIYDNHEILIAVMIYKPLQLL